MVRQQRNAGVIATQTQHWTRLILSFAKHRRIFYLKLDDAEQPTGSEWSDVFYNPRIKRAFVVLPERGVSFPII